MRSTLLVLGVLAASWHMTDTAQIPEKLFGKWELGESENYDAYLEAKGYPWILRWIIARAGCTRIFEKRSENTFRLIIETGKNTIDWDNIKLGEEFVGTYLDDAVHKVQFDYVPSGPERIIEKHKKINSTEPAEAYEYQFDKDGNMFMVMEAKGVVAKRFYSRIG